MVGAVRAARGTRLWGVLLEDARRVPQQATDLSAIANSGVGPGAGRYLFELSSSSALYISWGLSWWLSSSSALTWWNSAVCFQVA